MGSALADVAELQACQGQCHAPSLDTPSQSHWPCFAAGEGKLREALLLPEAPQLGAEGLWDAGTLRLCPPAPSSPEGGRTNTTEAMLRVWRPRRSAEHPQGSSAGPTEGAAVKTSREASAVFVILLTETDHRPF